MLRSPIRRSRIARVLRILLCGVMLTALVAGCLYLYYTAFDFYHARLLENESKTSAWLVEQMGYALPFAVICLFHSIVYHGDPRDGTFSREKFFEVALAAVLIYAILLPYLDSVSDALYTNALAAGEKIPKTDGGVEITLLMELHEWFVRLTIPLGVLLVYHGSRARRERLFPETEISEPALTVEEYEARKAAQLTASPTQLKEDMIHE